LSPEINRLLFKRFFCIFEKNNVMARLTEYDFDICVEICEEIANGGYILEVLESNEKYPSWSTFRRWKRDHSELQTMYVNAQQDKTEPIISNIKKVQLMALKGEIDASTANVVIQTDKWLSSKFYPKMFGDKIDHTTAGEKITSVSILNIDPLSDESNDSTS
jgi:hypothetical protein